VAPSSIAGLALWIRGDAGVTLDGSNNVTTWADQSGNGRDLTQGTAGKRPAGTAVTLNGLAVVRFDGSDDELGRATQNLQATWGITSAFTLAYTRRCNTGAGTSRPVFQWAPAPVTNEFTLWDAFTDDNLYMDCGNTGAGGRVNAAANPGTAWRRTVLRRNGTAFDSFREGSALFSASYSANLATGSASFNLGQIGGGFASMDLAELCLWNRALSDPERAQVDAWLSSRWGI
jgi:hypothetical protein